VAVVCDGLGDVATTQPRLVVARLEYNGRGDEQRRVPECCERVGVVGVASSKTAVGLCKDESEFVKKRAGTPGLALASFFSSRASLRTSDVGNGRRETGNCEARAGFVIVCDAIVQHSKADNASRCMEDC
jgi:hypothetical protein